MARTTILLDDALLLAVKQLARVKSTTATEIIRQALKAYVKREQRVAVPSFAAVGRSGQSSVSEQAEEILQREAKREEGW